jgi:hypothetical protein
MSRVGASAVSAVPTTDATTRFTPKPGVSAWPTRVYGEALKVARTQPRCRPTRFAPHTPEPTPTCVPTGAGRRRPFTASTTLARSAAPTAGEGCTRRLHHTTRDEREEGCSPAATYPRRVLRTCWASIPSLTRIVTSFLQETLTTRTTDNPSGLGAECPFPTRITGPQFRFFSRTRLKWSDDDPQYYRSPRAWHLRRAVTSSDDSPLPFSSGSRTTDVTTQVGGLFETPLVGYLWSGFGFAII